MISIACPIRSTFGTATELPLVDADRNATRGLSFDTSVHARIAFHTISTNWSTVGVDYGAGIRHEQEPARQWPSDRLDESRDGHGTSAGQKADECQACAKNVG